MEWNAESVLDALNDFERKSEIPEILDQYLERIAKNGEIVFPWNKLKPLLKKKLEVVLDEFYETCPVETSVPVPNFETFNFDNLKQTILTAVDAFTSAPFTIQRLCELVSHPTRHYNRTDKYMRGIEKNVLVVSTLDPPSHDNPPVVNGTADDNDTLNNGHPTTNVNNHVLLENFANVFPSAACIPAADNNFMAADDELVPVEQIDGGLLKDEEDMDTREDETLGPQPKDVTPEVKAPEDIADVVEAESSSSNSSLELASTDDSEDVKSEADCTEPVTEDSKSTECQQDDTVSQSDDICDDVSPEEEERDPEVEEVLDCVREMAGDFKLVQCVVKIDNVVAEKSSVISEVGGDVPKESEDINEESNDINEESDDIKEESDDIKEESDTVGDVSSVISDVSDEVEKVADDVALPVEETLPDVSSENDSVDEPSAMEMESSGSEEPTV